MERLIVVDPLKRLTSKKALHHPWIKNDMISQRLIHSKVIDRLKNVNSHKRLGLEFKKLLVNLIGEEDLEKITKTFEAIDLDHSG